MNLSTRIARKTELLLASRRLYCAEPPRLQNAVDIFDGEWTTRLPIDGTRTGSAFRVDEDPRVAWAQAQLGSVRGLRVLELGPLEGGHTLQLEKAGADVLGIEANARAFLRCLIVKNALDMRARFIHGNFTALKGPEFDHFDMVFASGVLYHLVDPAQLLLDIASRTDRLFIWSHFFDRGAVAAHSKLRRDFNKGKGAERVQRGGVDVTYHHRVYGPGVFTRLMPGFCGGMTTSTVWMELDDIVALLAHQGFTVRGLEVELNHPHGPTFQLAAARTAPTSAVSGA